MEELSGLSGILKDDAGVRLVEPHIYSVLPAADVANEYDTGFGTLYEWVACNPLYNRMLWGYSTGLLSSVALEALASRTAGHVLDLGCGSLTFTAGTYLAHSQRPMVLVDQSLKMLRMGKARVIRMKGSVPDHLVFLQADALRLPFRPGTFTTVISQNLFHCIEDMDALLTGLQEVITEDAAVYATTLVRAHRWADRYLESLVKQGMLISRSPQDHQAVFSGRGMSMTCDVVGNMAFIRCG